MVLWVSNDVIEWNFVQIMTSKRIRYYAIQKNKQLANIYPCCIDPCYFTKYNNWEQLFSAKSNTFKAKRYSADAVRNAFRCRRKNMETRGHREPDLEDIEFQFEDHDFNMQPFLDEMKTFSFHLQVSTILQIDHWLKTFLIDKKEDRKLSPLSDSVLANI